MWLYGILNGVLASIMIVVGQPIASSIYFLGMTIAFAAYSFIEDLKNKP